MRTFHPKGHMVVYTGEKCQFTIRVIFLEHPLFPVLLNQAHVGYLFQPNSKLYKSFNENIFIAICTMSLQSKTIAIHTISLQRKTEGLVLLLTTKLSQLPFLFSIAAICKNWLQEFKI